MFLFTYTAAFLAIIFAISAAFLLWKCPKDNVLAIIFTLALAASALWIGSNAAADVTFTFSAHVFWAGMAWIGAVSLLTLFVIFVDVFVDKKPPPLWRIGIFVLPSALSSLFAFSTTYYILDAHFPGNAPAETVPGVLFEIYVLIYLLATIYGFTRLMLFYRRSKGQPRLQSLYIMLGFAGLFIGQIIFTVLLPLAGELRFYSAGPQTSAILFGASAYAIFKHNLLNIQIWIQRGLIYSTLLAIVIALYVSILLFLQWYLSLAANIAAPISGALVIFAGIYGIPRLERYFRRITDHIFFKDRYEYSEVLEKLSRILNTEVEPQPLLEQCMETLVRELRLEYAEFEKHSGELIVRKAANGTHRKTIGFHIPVRLCTEEIGALQLGGKRSGDPYTPEDATLLRTFASQAAVAIKKADLYQELKEYSVGLEHKVHERTKHLKELQDAQRQMINDISHALQTPLAVIKTTTELLLQTQKNDTEKKRLSIIRNGADSLSHLVTNLLRLAKIDVEKEGLQKREINLSTTTQEVIDYVNVICQESNIELTTALEPNITVMGMGEHLNELITNLLSNAVKYTRTCPERHIRVVLSSSHEFAKLVVKDSGMGLKPQELPHVFDRFYRGKTHQHVTPGTGLGLAICNTIAKQHGGKLYVESEGPGKGATFTLFLPLHKK